MISRRNDCELEFCELCEQQSLLYDRAIGIANRIQAGPASAAEASTDLIDLQRALDEVAKCGPPVTEAQERWESLGVSAGPQLKLATQTLRSRIEQLLMLINQAESRFQAAREQLQPQVDMQVTARRMVDAYGERSQ